MLLEKTFNFVERSFVIYGVFKLFINKMFIR